MKLWLLIVWLTHDKLIHNTVHAALHSALCTVFNLFLITSHLGFLFSAVRILSGRAKTAGLYLSLIKMVLHQTQIF